MFCQWMRFFLSQTGLERSDLVLSRSTSEWFAARFNNSGRDQSDRSDFAVIKTCDETGRRASPISLLFLRG